MTSTNTDTTTRADARRNRERLLTAALELFATEGTDVSLKAVADAAGVGVGTIYRHFPTRDALLEAAYRNEVEQLCDVEKLLHDQPPEAALAEWMNRFVDYAVRKRGLSGALRSIAASGSDIYDETLRLIIAALTTLLEAGVAAGTIRADVDAEGVFDATRAIWLIPDEPGWADRARRVLALVMDGLRQDARA
ncbi:MAG: regulatory protein TetR [Actinomycetia bacterium]|jgi:AcrR family transcriptional regulator|nr:regulatory protein TetR [Actinomycetes bacterium]